MAKFKPKPGRTIDRWTLIEELGKGGNASVWKASDNGCQAAIKLLCGERDLSDEPLRRFRDEQRLMKSLNGRPGVMPFWGGQAEDHSDANSPAWIAMPVSVRLVARLGPEWTLRDAIEPVASYAATLAALHAEGISHRDLKPDNLFWLDGDWVIGDFGLAAFPEQEAHDTPVQKRFGPLFYQAPEMLNEARDAAGPPADVYALAKVLWQLGCGQTYPQPGVLDARVPALRLSSWAGEEALLLDDVLERSTVHRPSERLTMREFADELMAWLSPAADVQFALKPMYRELREIATRLSRVQEPTRRLREEDALFDAATERLRQQYPLEEIGEVYRSMGSIDGASNDSGNLDGLRYAAMENADRHVRSVRTMGWFVALGYTSAISGLAVGLLEGQDRLLVSALHRLGAETIWREDREIPTSGPIHEAEIREMVQALNAGVDDLVERVRTYLAEGNVKRG